MFSVFRKVSQTLQKLVISKGGICSGFVLGSFTWAQRNPTQPVVVVVVLVVVVVAIGAPFIGGEAPTATTTYCVGLRCAHAAAGEVVAIKD